MERILATFRDGQVVFDEEVDWPEGTRVTVSPCADDIGMDESEWPTTPEGIQVLLKSMNEALPLDLTPEELEQWDAELEARKKEQLKLMEKNIKELETLS